MNSIPETNNPNNRRGSEEKRSEPRFLVIGQVTKPHGVRGDVRVLPHTDDTQRFHWLEEVYIGDALDPVVVENARIHKGWALLKLAGYDSREAVEALRGEYLQVRADQAIPLEEGEYFLYQLLNLTVETEDGALLGTISEVIETGANNVFVVQGTAEDVLIPDIPEVVKNIDFDQKRMIIRLLPGLLNA